MSNDCQATLLVYQIDRAFYTQARLDAFLNKESQHMAFSGANLFANDKVKAVVAFCPQVAHAQ